MEYEQLKSRGACRSYSSVHVQYFRRPMKFNIQKKLNIRIQMTFQHADIQETNKRMLTRSR